MTCPARIHCALLLALVVLATACHRDGPRPGTPPRCVLLLTVEGLRADHVTAYGYIRQTTRVRKESFELVLDIDRMAETGVAFHNAFAPTPEVYPSLVSLLTGATPLEHGCLERGDTVSQSVSTLAEDLGAEGFVTAAFVAASPALLGHGLERGFGVGTEFGSDAEALKAATTWLTDSAPRDGRLFLWVHLGELRAPFSGEGFVDLYSAQGDSGGSLDLTPAAFLEGEQGALQRRRLVDRFDGAVSRTNLLMHAFLEYYKFGFLEDGLLDDSVVVVCGTQGVELAEREGRVGFGGALVEETLRVPLILRHPGSLTGRRIFDEPVTLADVAPTLRDWFSAESEGSGSGRSLLALTDSYIERDFRRQPAHAWRVTEGRVVEQSLRDERWRATFTTQGGTLYDLVRDPFAKTDVAHEQPELLSTWRELLAPPLAEEEAP